MRKPSSAAKLKTLPREPGERAGKLSQRELIAWMSQEGNSLQKTVAYLAAEWDLHTSVGALSEFWSWWHLSQRMQQAENLAKTVQDTLAKLNVGLTGDQIEAAGNLAFMTDALNAQDPKTFLAAVDRRQAREFATNKGKLEERKLALQERRVKLLEQKAAQADAVKSDLEQRKATGGLSEETLHMIERTLKMLS